MTDTSVDKSGAASSEPAAKDAELQIDETIDLRGVKCPMNFVKIKLKLEEMETGRNLEALVDIGEPMRSVPRAIKEEGHRIIHVDKLDADGGFSLLIKKGA